MEIRYLADHREVIPILARWSYEEWAHLHPDRTRADVERLMAARGRRDQIPTCLIAFDQATVIGMIALKTQDLETRPELSPWLAGLYVDKVYRNQGVGIKLIAAIEREAVRLGVDTLFLYTPGAERYYAKLNWRVRERTEWQGYPVTVMEKNLNTAVLNV